MLKGIWFRSRKGFTMHALKQSLLYFGITFFAAVSVTGCNSSSGTLDQALRAEIDARGLTGNPATGKSTTNINDPLPQLGMKLFFTKALGGDQDSACVSCHHPALGGGDNLSLSIGANAVQPDLLGPGRTHRSDVANYDGQPTVPRNAPTTFNVALYSRGMFWDSRVEQVAGGITTPASATFGDIDPDSVDIVSAQARFPVTSIPEMRGLNFEAGNPMAAVWTHLESRIGDYDVGLGELGTNQWVTEFQSVYGTSEPVRQLITFNRIVEAIGAYERSQVFINNPWKAYVEDDKTAISTAAKRGALLFFRSKEQGGANCASCHSGDFFTDENFHVVATPQIGRGKGDGVTGDDDFGRYRVTGDPVDKYAFRTPSLLNVTVTGPWGHVGSYTTLEGIVRHYIDPAIALQNYDYTQLDPSIDTTNTEANTLAALAKQESDRQEGRLSVEKVELSDAQVNDLLAFLSTLTDPCVTDRTCLAAWIPDAGDTNPDGLRINAFDKNGKLL